MQTLHNSEVVRLIPTRKGLHDLGSALSKHEPWFYEFRFSNGAVTETEDALAQTIHRTRADLIFPLLDLAFQRRWADIRCLDLACHEGWFATQIALRGAREVLGIDIRADHIAKAEVIRELADLPALAFKADTIYNVKPETHGEYELVLLLGVLYHLDNPLEALRNVRAVTRHLCVIESQVARASPDLECLWGSDTTPRRGPGIAIVPSDAAHVEPGKPIALVPTLDALYQMLYAVGFARLYLAVPPRHMYEQYPNLDRVIVFAQAV